MSKMFKKSFLYILVIFSLPACDFLNGDSSSYKKVPVERFIIVKTVDPTDGLTKFGAFILRKQKHSHSTYKFDWFFLINGDEVFSLPNEQVLVGHSEFSEQMGVDFSIFSFEVSSNDENYWWVQIPPDSLETSHSNKFCITEYTNIGDMIGEDLSSCNFIPEE